MFEMFEILLRNLLAGPATRLYPAVARPPFPGARGQLAGIDVERCTFCGLCQRKCPADAIVVDRPLKRWSIDPYRCVLCNACVEACPKSCILMEPQHRSPTREKACIQATRSKARDAVTPE